MRMRHLLTVGSVAAVAAVAPFAASATGPADSASGALQNNTPGSMKVLHTGTTQPSASWTDLGRLVLPVGSFVVYASSTFENRGTVPTGVDCFLKVPNGSAHAEGGLSAQKGSNVRSVATNVVVNAPNGGNVDLLCRVISKSADRRVRASDTSILAIAVPGVTLTQNPAPTAASAF